MSDPMFDAPAYCMLCNRPIAVGPTCDACNDDCEHANTSITCEHPGGPEYVVCEDCGMSWKTNRKDGAI